MSEETSVDRRDLLHRIALTGGALLLPGSRPAPRAKAEPEEEVSPAEDLMREHGVLNRILLVYEECVRRLSARRPDFAPRLLVSHPSEVKIAHAPLLVLLTELMEDASEAGQLRPEITPKRMAAMTMQTVMFVAQSSGSDDATVKPISAEEVWDFCANGFASS